MSLENIRAKTICLLALVGFYRPSDLAIVSRDQISFNDSGATIVNLGGKTDKNHDGFTTPIHHATDTDLCPVRALSTYLRRTPGEGPSLFNATPGHGPIGPQRIGRIMTNTLQHAGINDVTAKAFRKTGASSAIVAGIPPDAVMKIGRWKSVDTFFNCYVTRPPSNVSDLVFSPRMHLADEGNVRFPEEGGDHDD